MQLYPLVNLENPVVNGFQYTCAAKEFLKTLSGFGINEEYFDIRVNQPWYLPIFRKYYSFRLSKFEFKFDELSKGNQIHDNQKKKSR